MGLSSNQARFLSLTSRQIDLEKRVQEICQRRLRLSNQSERIAQHYNEQTSDRRLFLNTSDSFSSSIQNGTGAVTHDNLSDNDQYALLTASNLYDNGLHLFANGALINSDGSMVTKTKTGTKTFTKAEVLGKNVGDWVCPAPPLSYQLTVASSTPNTAVFIIPAASPSPAPTQLNVVPGGITDVPTGHTVNTTQQNGGWSVVGGSYTQNNTTGVASQKYTRNCSVEIAQSPRTVTQATTLGIKSTTVLGALTGGTGNPITLGSQTVYSFSYTDFAGRSFDKYAIGADATGAIDATRAKDQLIALSQSSTNWDENYILMSNVTLDGQWSPMGTAGTAFSGIFDGNLHEISGMNITDKNSVTGDREYQGLFGNLSGTVQNVNLKAPIIDLYNVGSGSSSGYAGGLVGFSGPLSHILNCNVTGLNMDIAQNGSEIGGIVGQCWGEIDKCSVTGSIDVGRSEDSIGGFAGWARDGKISRSYSGVNVDSGTSSSWGASFIGDCNYIDNDPTQQVVIENCYSTGTFTTDGGSNILAFVGDQNANIKNSYMLNGGTYTYWDDEASENWTGTNPTVSGLTTSLQADPIGTVSINNTPTNVWNDNGTSNPTLNIDAVNAESGTFTINIPRYSINTWTEEYTETVSPGMNDQYIADEYTDTLIPATPLTSEQLEAGLRDGSIKLAKHADTTTQNPVTVAGVDEKYEYVDWRTQSVISDDLYTANDEEAQSQYEHAIHDVNSQDKQLELEQTKITTEYTAITSEKEAVKKILDTNVKGSFKYFG